LISKASVQHRQALDLVLYLAGNINMDEAARVDELFEMYHAIHRPGDAYLSRRFCGRAEVVVKKRTSKPVRT
jgi:hypothetical protein